MRSIYYYGTTTITAVILGIILVSVIRPGEISGHSFNDQKDLTPIRNVTTTDTLLDLVRYLDCVFDNFQRDARGDYNISLHIFFFFFWLIDYKSFTCTQYFSQNIIINIICLFIFFFFFRNIFPPNLVQACIMQVS